MERKAEYITSLRLQSGNLALSLDRQVYSCRFVRAGKVRGAGGIETNIIIEPEALSAAAASGLFDAKSSFVDHAGFFDYPSLHNLAGKTQHSTYNPIDQSVEGEIKLYDTEIGNTVRTLLDQILAEDNPPNIGLSMVFYPLWAPRDNHEDPRRITGIKYIESIDLVFEPAADGRVLQALSSLSPTEAPIRENQLEFEHSPALNIEPAAGETSSSVASNYQLGLRSDEETIMPDEITPTEELSETPSPPVEETPAQAPDNGSEAWLSALGQSTTEAMITASGLPAEAQAHLLTAEYASPQDVAAAIEQERSYLATLQENSVIQVGDSPPRGSEITGLASSLDQIREAFEALLNGVSPENAQPLSGIRELYTLLSGDYEMTGLFHPDRIQFANVTTSTMANMTADLLNKRVMAEFANYPQWWLPIVNIEDFSSLQDVKWIVLGGVGELPTVAEGAAYTELTWDDQKESDAFIKKGGYLGITLEAIDKDDTGRLRAAPRALAQSAWLTLSKSISAIFTANSGIGPTMSDALALFHATHGNLGTTALSVTTWSAARLAMRKMTELNSGERLGALTAPKFLLVPPDLEITALQVLASEYDYTYALSNGTASPVNVATEGDSLQARMAFARSRVIVVDLWSDVNDWAASGDPKLYPTIGLGFRYGRVPEVFSVASPTAGLMFTNDTMPVKVRYFFATGPIDYRNLYKANVA